MFARRLDERRDAESGAGAENDARPLRAKGDGTDLARPPVGDRRQRQRLRLEIVEQQPAGELQPLGDLAPVDMPGRIRELQFAVDNRPGAAGDRRAWPRGEFGQDRLDRVSEAGIVAGMDMHGFRQRRVGALLEREPRIGAADVRDEDGKIKAHPSICRRARAAVKAGSAAALFAMRASDALTNATPATCVGGGGGVSREGRAARPIRTEESSMGTEAAPRAFLEFFCGGGMARVGLGARWRCQFANDIDVRKARAYAANFGPERLIVKDVAAVQPEEVGERADLAWASFPCQDLSLAGAGAGLNGGRSGAFWSFWRLIQRLRAAGRAPRLIALENVCGLTEFARRVGFRRAARRAVRRRLCCRRARHRRRGIRAAIAAPPFLLAAADDVAIPGGLTLTTPPAWGAPPALRAAHARLPRDLRARFLWWRLPPPPRCNAALADLVEDTPAGVEWASARSRRPAAVSDDAAASRARRGGGGERRSPRRGALSSHPAEPRRGQGAARRGAVRRPRRVPAHARRRFEPAIAADRRERAHARAALGAREAARLMGLPDSYVLPQSCNEAYHLLGDGVVAAVVRHLADHWMASMLRDVA